MSAEAGGARQRRNDDFGGSEEGREAAAEAEHGAEGKARIAEATRKRWAEYRAQKAAR